MEDQQGALGEGEDQALQPRFSHRRSRKHVVPQELKHFQVCEII